MTAKRHKEVDSAGGKRILGKRLPTKKEPSGMPSRDDVARAAGVSGATVSYVMNQTPGITISEKTRKRVLAAAAKLKYQPSQAARAMVRGRYDQIGILMPRDDLASHWYHLGVLQGAWQEVIQHRIRLVMDAVVPGGTLSFVNERFVDGLIAPGIGPETLTQSVRDHLAALRIPVVVIGSGSWSEDFHTVDVDNRLVGLHATRHLLEHGHRRLLYFGGCQDSKSVCRRREGFREALAETNVPQEHARTIDGPYNTPEALVAARKLLDQGLDATAVVCYNDAVAHGLWMAALERGMSVPGDLSLIGVDANPEARIGPEVVSTICQPLQNMGRRAVELIQADSAQPVHEVMPFDLRPGDTVGVVRLNP